LSVRKRMTVRCSINIPNIRTGIDVLKTSAEAALVGATKIFERKIGEEEIICQMQSFILIRAHHWVRQGWGYELSDRPYKWLFKKRFRHVCWVIGDLDCISNLLFCKGSWQLIY
jgi:hypothetical protein